MRPSGRLSCNGSIGQRHSNLVAKFALLYLVEVQAKVAIGSRSLHMGISRAFSTLTDSRQQLYRHSSARLRGDLRHHPCVAPFIHAWRLAVISRSIAVYGASIGKVRVRAKGVPVVEVDLC